MKKKITICGGCKKNSDFVLVNMVVGDEKILKPGTKIGDWKCERCGRVLTSGEKMLRVKQN